LIIIFSGMKGLSVKIENIQDKIIIIKGMKK